jgi:hypothetical protein
MQTQVGDLPQAPSDRTLWVAVLTSVFCSFVAAIYAAAYEQALSIVDLFLAWAPLVAVILWLQKDARRTGVGAVQDWGFFLLLFWPIVIPWYAWKTRGRRWWWLMLGLMALILSPFLAGFLVSWMLYGSQ